MATAREGSAARIRVALAHQSTTREVQMFGGLSFTVRQKMVVAVRGDCDLLVRVDPGRHRELVALDGARPAEMGAGRRPMGPGWISVGQAAISTDEELAFWIGAAMEYNAGTAQGPH